MQAMEGKHCQICGVKIDGGRYCGDCDREIDRRAGALARFMSRGGLPKRG